MIAQASYNGAMIDILYVVKQEEDNEELRYSLRSLRNIPHGKVFMAGYKPSWVSNKVIHIPVVQDRTKYKNSTNNLLTACNDPRLSSDFLLFNDDFFVMRPMKEMPVFNRGSNHDVTAEYKAKGSGGYVNGMIQTEELLHQLGVKDVINYELHVPMHINKHKFIDVIQMQRDLAPHIRVVHKRTLYGNFWKLGGKKISDVKVYHLSQEWSEAAPLLSTLDNCFKLHPIGDYIRSKFPNPSPYEKDGYLNYKIRLNK